MKIAYVLNNIILCGGVIVPFEHCRELRKKGIDAGIYANDTNEELNNRYPDVPVYGVHRLNDFTDDDVIVAVWWMQIPELEKFKGRKIQFVQGNDVESYIGDDLKASCKEIRSKKDWEVLAVSKYSGEWTERPYTVIPNGINEIFFKKIDIERDIDALIEGNYEPNKNIDCSIILAKSHGHKKIVWFGRETHPIDGVECITNPSLEEIHKLYYRSKHFYKHSKSEGFCLPIAEAQACGCEIHTWDQGNNLPEKFKPEDYKWSNIINDLCTYLTKNKN